MTAADEIRERIKAKYPDGLRSKKLHAVADPEIWDDGITDLLMIAVIRTLEAQVNEAIATGAKRVYLNWVNSPSFGIGVFGRAYDQVVEKIGPDHPIMADNLETTEPKWTDIGDPAQSMVEP